MREINVINTKKKHLVVTTGTKYKEYTEYKDHERSTGV